MNIEQIADAVSKEMLGNVATLQPELVKWNREYIHRCLSKLAEQLCNTPAAIVDEYELFAEHDGAVYAMQFVPVGTKLYTETQLLAAQQRTAEACAKVCEATADKYQETESRLWPECRSDAQSGASSCEGSIRNGEWREYL